MCSCKYCAGEATLLSGEDWSVFIHGERLVCLVGDEEHDYREIKACPVCGEPLAAIDPPTMEQINLADTIAELMERANPVDLIPSECPGIAHCPRCNQELISDDDNLHFCPSCGQAVTRPEDDDIE
jgi:predicted RNA-binding Zn-ribbon protein involved in translation (DUF1610 family)